MKNKCLRERFANGYLRSAPPIGGRLLMVPKSMQGLLSMAWKGTRNAEIEKLYSEGASYAALARQFELSPSRVQQIIANTRRMRKKLQARLDAPLRHST